MNEEWKRDFEQRLRAVNWSQIDHAFGPATNLPDELMKYVEVKSTDVWSACGEFLHFELTHQGTRYPATLAAIPFLAEMLENLPDKRPHLIEFLIQSALCCAEWYYPQGFRPENLGGAYMTAEFKLEIYQATEKLCFPLFLSLAGKPNPQQLTFPDFPMLERDERTEVLALWALGWFPARFAESRVTLENSAQPIAEFALEMLNNALRPAELSTQEKADDQYQQTIRQIYL